MQRDKDCTLKQQKSQGQNLNMKVKCYHQGSRMSLTRCLVLLWHMDETTVLPNHSPSADLSRCPLVVGYSFRSLNPSERTSSALWSPWVTPQVRNAIPDTQKTNDVICLVQSHSAFYLLFCLFFRQYLN